MKGKKGGAPGGKFAKKDKKRVGAGKMSKKPGCLSVGEGGGKQPGPATWD